MDLPITMTSLIQAKKQQSSQKLFGFRKQYKFSV